ncbi:MAG: hypothetical protein AAFN17_07030, partial [Pseudomonadota bacterium]
QAERHDLVLQRIAAAFGLIVPAEEIGDRVDQPGALFVVVIIIPVVIVIIIVIIIVIVVVVPIIVITAVIAIVPIGAFSFTFAAVSIATVAVAVAVPAVPVASVPVASVPITAVSIAAIPASTIPAITTVPVGVGRDRKLRAAIRARSQGQGDQGCDKGQEKTVSVHLRSPLDPVVRAIVSALRKLGRALGE